MSTDDLFQITHPGTLKFMELENTGWAELRNLSRLFASLPEEMDWRYDDDSSLREWSSAESAREGFHETLDAFRVDTRAQSLACAWRVREATIAGVFALNQGMIAAAAGLARLALESATLSMSRFEDLLTRIRALNNAKTTDKFLSEFNEMDDANNKANFGRHSTNPGGYPYKSVSIQTHLSKAKKYLEKAGYIKEDVALLERLYVDLSELTHPNAEGLQIYWNLEHATPLFPGAPSYRKLERNRGLEFEIGNLSLTATTLAFSKAALYSVEVFKRIELLDFKVIVAGHPPRLHVQVLDETNGNALVV